MQYIENYRDWVCQEWLDHISQNTGVKQNGAYNKPAGKHYPFEGFNWELFDRHNTDFDISPPVDWGTHDWQWWFKKLLPGDGFPVVEYISETTSRYWMPLNDYELGHIFIFQEEMVAPFNKGDLFDFQINSPYAAINLGTQPFYLMMFSVSREKQWNPVPPDMSIDRPENR